MTSGKRACCPICRRVTATFIHGGQRIYVHHHLTRRGRASILSDPDVCEASGWLVEDDELVTAPHRPSPLKDIAQPPRSVCRRCLGEGLYEGDLCRRCAGTGTTTPTSAPCSQENQT